MNLHKINIFSCIFLLTVTVSSAFAGWFSPSPPELIIDKQIKVQQGNEVRIPIIFDERSHYRIRFYMEPRVDFHSEEGKRIKWGQRMKFKMTIEGDGDVFVEEEVDQVLNHSLGFGFDYVRVPGQAPKNKQLFIKIVFTEVASDYNSIYKTTKIFVDKLPSIRFLD